MHKYSKKYNNVSSEINKNEKYSIEKAVELLKKTSITKFDSTIEVVFRLNVDPRHADQQLRGSFVLPEGSGKKQKILALTNSQHDAAKKAGADYVGGEDLIEKIKKENWFDFDIIVATPDIMGSLGRIGRILGPKGLMPNIKTKTITQKIELAISEIKKGKISYRVDKNGNLHLILGKVSFTTDSLINNYNELFKHIVKQKPAAIKGKFIKNIALSSTMGPGISLEYN